MDIFTLILWMILGTIAFCAVWWLIAQLDLGPPFAKVVRILVVLAALVLIFGVMFGYIVLPPIYVARR